MQLLEYNQQRDLVVLFDVMMQELTMLQEENRDMQQTLLRLERLLMIRLGEIPQEDGAPCVTSP